MESQAEVKAVGGTACSAASTWADNSLHAAFDNAPLAEASKRSYRATLSMFARCHALVKRQGLAGGQSAPATLAEWMAKPSCAWPAIRQAYPAVRTQQQVVKCILAVFKYALHCGKDCVLSQTHNDACDAACGDAHGQWHVILRQLDQQVRAQVASSEMSAREEAAWIEYADVRAAEQRLRMECGSPRHLLLSFAALTEPVRGGDLGRVHVCMVGHVPATGNYVELSTTVTAAGKAVLVLRDHKTAHAAKVGTLVRVLPHHLATVVQASLRASPRQWLFEAPRGGPFTEEAHFTSWANRVYKGVFGKPVTANTLRHAFISSIDMNRTSTAALEATATRFGHSLATQIAYRRLSPSRKRKLPLADDTGELLVTLKGAEDEVQATAAYSARGAGHDELDLQAAYALLDMARPNKEPRRVTVSQRV